MGERLRDLLRRFPWVLLFALFVGVYSCLDLTQTDREKSELENRHLATRPKVTWKALMSGEFDETYDKYINDQFVGRDGWITVKSMTETALLKRENNGIVFGADGYLFRKYDTLNLSDAPGRFQENAAYLREFFEMIPDQPATAVIVPSAYELLPDKVPFGLRLVDQRAELTSLYASLPDHVTPLDLFAPLEAHGSEYLYYRTDPHWTSLGAYHAAQAYAQARGLLLPALEELGEPKQKADFYGTNFSTAKKIGTPGDTLTYYDIPTTSVTVGGQAREGLYDLSKLSERDKYAMFLWGNNNFTEIRSENNRNPRPDGRPSRVLLVKDSFGNCFAPFLTYLYDEVDVADLRFLPGLSDTLSKKTYDDVIVLYQFETLARDAHIASLRY